jgi:succinate-semialdehyde dehydrogenase/glutarate-semialdehyde dehydrogenase
MHEIIENSFQAFKIWKKTTLEKRADLLFKLALLLENNKNTYAQLITQEMGKPITESRAEITKCAWACTYFAEEGPDMLKDSPRKSAFPTTFIRYEALGPLLAIMPWNFPFWQVFRMAAPALLSGNTILLKHSEITPRCALAIADLFIEAGAPANLMQLCHASHEQIPEIISDDRIRGISLTGSTKAGQAVAALAGKYLKKIVLELGGSDPFIVLEDAPVEKIASIAALARCQNTGQSCVASKRFIVPNLIFDKFLDYFVCAMKKLVVGNPLDERTQIGPLAHKNQQQLLEAQVNDARAKGAKILCGGVVIAAQGSADSFYPPTVITGIDSSMRIYTEEVFGPVACVYSYSHKDEAIKLANATPFGLAASIWTADESSAQSLINNLEFGSVFINALPCSDPRVPFGGVKNSGLGHELGREGLLEFVNQKVISITQL